MVDTIEKSQQEKQELNKFLEGHVCIPKATFEDLEDTLHSLETRIKELYVFAKSIDSLKVFRSYEIMDALIKRTKTFLYREV